MYEVRITPEGLRNLNRLPDKIRDAALAALAGPVRENPRQVGKALVGDLAGLYSTRRGDYRIIYQVDDDTTTLIIHPIQHRSTVYRPR